MATFKEKLRRAIAFIFGLFECGILVGCTFNWTALVYMLKGDGVYSHLCTNSTGYPTHVATELSNLSDSNVDVTVEDANHTYSHGCPEQDKMMNACFTAGIFVIGGSQFFIGWLMDSKGIRICRIGGMVFFVSGCLLIGFTSEELPSLIFPGYLLLCFGSMSFALSNNQIGNFFDAFQLSVVTIYNAAIDSSGTTFLFIKLLYDDGIPRLYSFIGLAILCLILDIPSTFFLLPKTNIIPRRIYKVQKENKGIIFEARDEPTKSKSEAEEIRTHGVSGPASIEKDTRDEATNPNSEAEEMPTHEVSELANIEEDNRDDATKPKSEAEEMATHEVSGQASIEQAESTEIEIGTTCIQEMPFYRHLITRVFIFHFIWDSLFQLRLFYYMGTLDVRIRSLADSEEEVSLFTNISSVIWLISIVGGPLQGLLLHLETKRLKGLRMGFYGNIKPAVLPQAIGSTIIVSLSILVLIPIKELFYVQLVLMALGRNFLFGMTFAFIVMAFPSEHFGKIAGLLLGICSFVTALQYPLFILARDNEFLVDAFLLFLVCLTYLQPLHIMLGDRCRAGKRTNTEAIFADS